MTHKGFFPLIPVLAGPLRWREQCVLGEGRDAMGQA